MAKSGRNLSWTRAVADCADPKRAGHYLKLLQESPGWKMVEKASLEQCAIIASLFSGSESLASFLLGHPDEFKQLDRDSLRFPRRKQGLAQQLEKIIAAPLQAQQLSDAFKGIREFQQSQMLRIGARDLAGLGTVSEITQELSDLADVCLGKIWQICAAQMEERHGRPWHQDANGQWCPTPACVIGLGKLGGQELNYSSDVDLMFVYSEEGQVFRQPPEVPKVSRKKRASGETLPSRSTLSNHQFFNRLAEMFVTEVSRLSGSGTLYRVDLRLRPEGDAGPLTRSLAGFENYYAQWGQTWERMMLIKARCIAGSEILAAEFLEMVQPFRYPRSVNEDVLREIGAMKDRIETEVVKSGELERNVKLGRGGIREIEFIVQSLQLLHAGRQPFLQGSQTLPGLNKMVEYELLPRETATLLNDAYCFLRQVEHRLQMDQQRQTHTVPEHRNSRERLARLMQFRALPAFEQAWRAHRDHVRQSFEELLRIDSPGQVKPASLPSQFEGAEAVWKGLLEQYAFKDPDRAFRVLRQLVEGPGYVHVSPRTTELAMKLIPRLFGLCGPLGATRASATAPRKETRSSGSPNPIPLSDPDRVVTRLDSFISAYGARATLFELWNSNPAIFDLLLLLFDRSEFLAELAIRTPDLVDELVTSGRLRQRKSAEETLRDLRHGIDDPDQKLWLRRYHQAELMRIGLRDILGLADFEQYLTELSALADACLQYAFESVLQRNRIKHPPFAIIGLGKLGGAEIDYGSDLDIIFVADPKASNLQKLSKLALQIMDLVSARTEQGLVFQTDARLRPDGEKGLLVNSLRAYEEYYRHRAQLWEIQSLTRTRAIAGHRQVGIQFQHLTAALTNFSSPSQPLAAFSNDWKAKIQHMRQRIEKERTPRGKDELAIKTGAGGLMDAEFIAQVLCLEEGWQEANTVRALERGAKENLLPGAASLIDNYRRLRRVEGILRRWSYEGETVLPDEPAAFYRVSVRCGFESAEAFREAVSQYRRAIRTVYTKILPS